MPLPYTAMQCHRKAALSCALALPGGAMLFRCKSRRRFSMPLPRFAWRCAALPLLYLAFLCLGGAFLRFALISLCVANPRAAIPPLCFALRSFASPCLCSAMPRSSIAYPGYPVPPLRAAILGCALPLRYCSRQFHRFAMLRFLCFADALRGFASLRRSVAKISNSAAEVRVALLSHRFAVLC